MPWSVPAEPFSRAVRPNSVIASTVVLAQFAPRASRSVRIAAESWPRDRPITCCCRAWLSQPASENAAIRVSPFNRLAAKVASFTASAEGPLAPIIRSSGSEPPIASASAAASRNRASS